jgi:uncharacterized membrane protein YeaQ/YmgE (transglycosylase-associated protein family)
MLHDITLDQFLVILLVGAVAGFLATHVVAGHGYGIVGDIVIGVLGALIGSFVLGGIISTYVLGPLGIAAASVLGQIVIAFIGAVVLLAVLRLVTGGAGRQRRVM